MVGEPFNKRSVPCAFGIKIGLYFQKETATFIWRLPLLFVLFTFLFFALHFSITHNPIGLQSGHFYYLFVS